MRYRRITTSARWVTVREDDGVLAATVQERASTYAPMLRDAVGVKVADAKSVLKIVSTALADEPTEVFLAVGLDGKSKVVGTWEVSRGTLTSSLVHPREVFAPALMERCYAIVVAHNHPSGDPQPSREDLEITARLVEAGRILGIALLDHVIVGDGRHVSLQERGHIPDVRE